MVRPVLPLLGWNSLDGARRELSVSLIKPLRPSVSRFAGGRVELDPPEPAVERDDERGTCALRVVEVLEPASHGVREGVEDIRTLGVLGELVELGRELLMFLSGEGHLHVPPEFRECPSQQHGDRCGRRRLVEGAPGAVVIDHGQLRPWRGGGGAGDEEDGGKERQDRLHVFLLCLHVRFVRT